MANQIGEVIAEVIQPHWKQVDLFKGLGVEAEFTSDDWETPDSVAKAIASLVLPSDFDILEPAAGRGQIAKYLPRDRRVTLNEIKVNRFDELCQIEVPGVEWEFRNYDFLGKECCQKSQDLVIGNPPFSLWAEFLARSLDCLNAREAARVLFLLPGDFSSSVSNAKALGDLDCHISHRYKIIGRVGYLKEGQQFKQRQVYDCVFEFRKGRKTVGESVLCYANGGVA
jgi:hypothetical protein